jgi:hypothetical protein
MASPRKLTAYRHKRDFARTPEPSGEAPGPQRGGASRFVVQLRDRSGQEQWLLLHKRDQYAVSGWDPGNYPGRCSAGAPSMRSSPTRGGCGARTCRLRRLPSRPTAVGQRAAVQPGGSGPPESTASSRGVGPSGGRTVRGR